MSSEARDGLGACSLPSGCLLLLEQAASWGRQNRGLGACGLPPGRLLSAA